MRVFRLPDSCKVILFDLDSTLYTNKEYARSQIDLPIERLAHQRGKTFIEMNDAVTRYREDWAREHNGQQINLGSIFQAFGVSIEESIRWREELYCPERYLTEDRQLRDILEQLKTQFALAVVTNSPVSIALRTLRLLGVEDLFQEEASIRIIGLDTCGVSKPDKQPFLQAATLCGTVPQACVSVGDRYDIDIAIPLELGMGGILVDGVEDVYQLPEILQSTLID